METAKREGKMENELENLRARLDGLQIAVAIALNMLPDAEVKRRLSLLEETCRKNNGHTETIAVLREIREKWET
jgi:hypothetical protein